MAAPSAARAAPVGRGRLVRARDVRNGWGVCGAPGMDAPPADYARMMGLIGTRDLRAHLVQNGATASAQFEALRHAMQAAGLSAPAPRLTVLVTAYRNDPTSWTQQQPFLLAFAKTGLLRAIEAPNEINNRVVGSGSHGPDDLTDRTEADAYPGNYMAWAQALAAFRQAHAGALPGVALVAPSIASGLQADYARLPDVSALVDAGNLHFYAGRGRQPSYSMFANPVVGYFQNLLDWVHAAAAPGKPMWLTETGATTDGSYARDGVSQAKYIANQMFDFFAGGGQRLFIYQLIDGSGREGDSEGNYGLFHSDGTAKPAAEMLGRLKDLLSLGAYDDPANGRDTAGFTPGYDGQRLAVSGLNQRSQSGPGFLVMPKSDGSTVIAVWNEPMIDDGQGHNVDPAEDVVTVDFGGEQSYAVHDLLDPAGARPVFQTASMARLSLRGYPMLIELRARPG